MEIVTGKAGVPHVSSADDGRRIAGEVGSGSYVLQTGGKLAPSLVDANTVRFATGDMIVQGRHIGITSPEDVKVASGSQGKKRMDYICVHYSRDVSGANPTLVETVEWTVLRGTPGTDATAPSVPKGSILDGDADVTVPVASVTFDGLTTGQPKLLIPELTPLATLGDSVSHEVFTSSDNGSSVTVTPSRDCAILAVCVWAGAWGYGGGDVKLSIDCPELAEFMKQASSLSGGDTMGRDLTSRVIFTGAKKGTSYRITRAVIGTPQGHGDRRLFAICL